MGFGPNESKDSAKNDGVMLRLFTVYGSDLSSQKVSNLLKNRDKNLAMYTGQCPVRKGKTKPMNWSLSGMRAEKKFD